MSVLYKMNFKIEFRTAIRGHHIHKRRLGTTYWTKIKTDTREEAIEYDQNAIGVF